MDTEQSNRQDIDAEGTVSLRTHPGNVPTHWVFNIGHRLVTDMPYKAIGTTVFMTLFFIVYLQLLHYPVNPVTIMPLTPMDHWIVFEPWSLTIYLTLWVYVSLPPALILSRRVLFGYGASMGMVCLIGLVIFWLWPTAVPTPQIDWARFPGFAALKGVDGTGNACPSLHVAAAVFSGFWLHQLLRLIRVPGWMSVFNALWCVAIVYSTMATKQHVFWDAAAGFALGAAGALLSLHWSMPHEKVSSAAYNACRLKHH
ncbi:MAG TPA: phosphatase PAP2 family protein [Halothiobacillus sp.]|nr:phosphatase PAP2 family protein [Halothiobacillus sp.]